MVIKSNYVMQMTLVNFDKRRIKTDPTKKTEK